MNLSIYMLLYGFRAILSTQPHLSSKVVPCGKYGGYHPHFTDEETYSS